MERLALYTKDSLLLNRWQSFLTNYEIKVIEDYEDLIKLENSLLILSSCVNLENEEFIIFNLLKKDNKILFLERVPQLQNAKTWFDLGIQGYGNSMMASIYLNSAVETIFNGYIWLLPEVTTQLIKNISINKSESTDDILKNLTKAEEKIAILIKNGYTNVQISEELDTSINTVKTHIKHIYEKLQVNDRLSFVNLFLNKR